MVDGGDDFDVLDLSAWGHSGTNIQYDVNNPENGTVDFLDADRNIIGSMVFTNIENVIPCFTPGTMIATPKGEVPVETLKAGDKIITRDNAMVKVDGLAFYQIVDAARATYADLGALGGTGHWKQQRRVVELGRRTVFAQRGLFRGVHRKYYKNNSY